MGAMESKYNEIKENVLKMPYGKFLWNGSKGIKGIKDELAEKAASLADANDLERFANGVIVQQVDTSSLKDEDKMAYYGQFNKNPDFKLDFGKMLENGEIKMGEGLTPEARLKLAVQYKTDPTTFNNALTEARKKYVANSQEGLDQQIIDQKAYYGAITSGDTDTANAIAKNYEGNPSFQAFKEEADKEALGIIGKGANLIAEMAAPSVMNKLNNAVSTGEEVTLGDMTRAGIADVGSNLVLGGIGKAAKLANWVPKKEVIKATKEMIPGYRQVLKGITDVGGKIGSWTPTTKKGLLGQKVAEMALSGAGATGTELARQAVAGEDIDLKSAGIAGASQGVANGAIDFTMGKLLDTKIPGISQIARAIKRSNRQDNDFNWKWNAAERAENIDKAIRNGGDDLFVMTKKEALPANEQMIGALQEGSLYDDKLSTLDTYHRAFKDAYAMPDGPEKEERLALLEEYALPRMKALAKEVGEGGKAKLKRLVKESKDFAKEDLKYKSAELKRAIKEDPDELIVKWAKGETAPYPELESRAQMLASDWNVVNKRNKKGQFKKTNTYSPAYLDIASTRMATAETEDDPYRLQRWANGYATIEEQKTPEYQQWKLGNLGIWTNK